MAESVVDEILHHERWEMTYWGIGPDALPVWDDDAGLFLKPMSLLDRVSYRNWQYANPDLPHHMGELYRRSVCDAAGNLLCRDEPADRIEAAVDRFALLCVMGHALVLLRSRPTTPTEGSP